jgi:hypothetical protein
MSLLALPCFGANTGNELLKQCSDAIREGDGEHLNGTEHTDASYCIGFVQGAVQAFGIVKQMNEEMHIENRFPCLADKITMGQLVRITVKWMKSNPEQLHFDASSLVLQAMMGAFPCK